MSLPKAVKITQNGVEIISNVDRIQYTLKELERAALRDVGKLVCKRSRQKIKRRTGRLAKNTRLTFLTKNTAQYRRTAWIWQKMNSILTNRYIAVTIL